MEWENGKNSTLFTENRTGFLGVGGGMEFNYLSGFLVELCTHLHLHAVVIPRLCPLRYRKP